MSDFPFEKSPGGKSFGTVERFKSPKLSGSYIGQGRLVSPGPLMYETASTLNFSQSTLSISSSQPSFAFRQKFTLPGEAARLRESGKETALEIPKIVGNTTQPSSRIRSEPAYSMGPKHRSYASPSRAHMPSPLDYTLPRPRVYEDKRDKNLGSDDRFGDVGERSAVRNPGSGQYDADDHLTRTDSYTAVSHTFTGRPVPTKTSERMRERSPGPHVAGGGYQSKNDVMTRSPVWSMGLKEAVAQGSRSPSRRQPLEPGPLTYQARSLYWTNKKELGKSPTVQGRARTAAAISIHKDVQGGGL